MANQTIFEFSDKASLVDTDVMLLQEDSNGTTYKVTIANLRSSLLNNAVISDKLSIRGTVTMSLGGDGDAVLTDNVGKSARVGTPHYSNSEEDMGIFYTVNSSASNLLRIGGGTSSYNAMTSIQFFAASNTTTTIGTLQMEIGDGEVIIGTDPGGSQLLRVGGGIYADSFTFGSNSHSISSSSSNITFLRSGNASSAYLRFQTNAATNIGIIGGTTTYPLQFVNAAGSTVLGDFDSSGNFSVLGNATFGGHIELGSTLVSGTGGTRDDVSISGRCSFIYNGSSSNLTITGFDAGTITNTRYLTVWNNTTYSVTLSNEDTSSSVGNRLRCPGNTDLVLGQYRGVVLMHPPSATFDRWTVITYT